MQTERDAARHPSKLERASGSRPGASSRSHMLNAIRGRKLAAVTAPDLAQPWITYADPSRQFAEMLTSVGGRCLFLQSDGELSLRLQEHPAYSSAKKVVSRVAGIAGNVDLDAVTDPHDLEDVDFAVLPAHFGVAENGAVWITDEGIKQRAVYFIVQHLVLVLDARQIVHNMHEAYQRLQWGERGFGAFLSGPSKTADIEQSLVIGAHGPRSLTVCFRPH